MKCGDCGAEMIYLQGAYICPVCDDYEEESLDKTLDEEHWEQGV